MNLSMLDLKMRTENLLAFWAGQIAVTSGVGAPQEHSVPVLAGWLQRHLWVFDEAPWGGMAAEEIAWYLRWCLPLALMSMKKRRRSGRRAV